MSSSDPPPTDNERSLSRCHRENNIRVHSERYGRRWCTDNASQLGLLIREWRKGNEVDLTVRCYDRKANTIKNVKVDEIFGALEIDPETQAPVRLAPTAFGQCAVTINMHVSSAIYQLIQACWMLERSTDHIM